MLHRAMFTKPVITWLGVWMLTLPLVHVHPEADHRHGLPGHVHGGTFHSVLSPQLSCANTTPRVGASSDPSLQQSGEHQILDNLAHHNIGVHQEYGFSTVSSSSDWKQDLGNSIDAIFSRLQPILSWTENSIATPVGSPPSSVLSQHHVPRAPPSLSM